MKKQHETTKRKEELKKIEEKRGVVLNKILETDVDKFLEFFESKHNFFFIEASLEDYYDYNITLCVEYIVEENGCDLVALMFINKDKITISYTEVLDEDDLLKAKDDERHRLLNPAEIKYDNKNFSILEKKYWIHDKMFLEKDFFEHPANKKLDIKTELLRIEKEKYINLKEVFYNSDIIEDCVINFLDIAPSTSYLKEIEYDETNRSLSFLFYFIENKEQFYFVVKFSDKDKNNYEVSFFKKKDENIDKIKENLILHRTLNPSYWVFDKNDESLLDVKYYLNGKEFEYEDFFAQDENRKIILESCACPDDFFEETKDFPIKSLNNEIWFENNCNKTFLKLRDSGAPTFGNFGGIVLGEDFNNFIFTCLYPNGMVIESEIILADEDEDEYYSEFDFEKDDFPIIYDGKEWKQEDCNEIFLNVYSGKHSLNYSGGVYLSDNVYVFPDGSMSED